MATPTINSRPEATVNGVLSQWNAANLPLQYEIENTKWPTNSDDLTDTIGSVSNSNGYARLNLSTTNETYTAKLWVVVTGTTSYNGVHRVRAATVSTITIDFPASGSETGTVQIYYQNYTTLIKVYAGLDPAHTHAADKPMTLIGTIEQRPDTDNITYVDVRNYVKAQLNTNWDETQSSWPNDLNIWCDFYTSVAERYDSVSAGDVVDFTSAYTDDSIYCHAVHGALQFGSATGGNMGEYLAIDSVYKSANAKWMTTFERPKIIDYNEFFLSVIIESTEDLFILIQEFDINGDLIDYDFLGYADQDYGVYRLSIDYLFTEASSFASVQLFSGIYTELSEELFIDIDVSCAEIVDAPIDLTVEAVSGSQIDGVFTDTSGGEAVHQVYWSLSPDTGFILLTSLSAGITSFSHTGLTETTTYYYKVRALIDGVVSQFSNIASATTFSTMEFTTFWNTSTQGNFQLTMTGLPSTAIWIFSDGSELTGSSINTNKSLLDGTDQLITIAADFTSVTEVNWNGKRIKGILDFEKLEAITSLILSVSGTSTALNQITEVHIPNSNILSTVTIFGVNNLVSMTFPSSNNEYMSLSLAGNAMTNATIAGIANLTGGFSTIEISNGSGGRNTNITSVPFNTSMTNKGVSNRIVIRASFTSLDLIAFTSTPDLRLDQSTSLSSVTNWPAVTTRAEMQSTALTSFGFLAGNSTISYLDISSTPVTSLDLSANTNLRTLTAVPVTSLSAVTWPIISTGTLLSYVISGDALVNSTFSTFSNLTVGFTQIGVTASNANLANQNITSNFIASILTNKNVSNRIIMRTGITTLDISMFDTIAQVFLNTLSSGPTTKTLTNNITYGASTLISPTLFDSSEGSFSTASPISIGDKNRCNTIDLEDNLLTGGEIDTLIATLDANKANFSVSAKSLNVGGSSMGVPSGASITTMTNLASSDNWTFTYWDGASNVVIT